MCPFIVLFSPTFAVTDSLMMGNSEPSRAPKLQDITDIADVKGRPPSPSTPSRFPRPTYKTLIVFEYLEMTHSVVWPSSSLS